MKTRISSLLVACLLSLASCTSVQHGARKYQVTLASEPPGARLYLVPRETWLSLAEPRLEADLKPYQRSEGSGVSPMTLPVYGYRYVLVAEKDGVRDSVDMRPEAHGQTFTVRLEGASDVGD